MKNIPKFNGAGINQQESQEPVAGDSVSIISYKTDKPVVKSKVQLQQNLFSFLLEGNKQVHYASSAVRINANQFLLLSAGNCLMTEKSFSDTGHYRSVLLFFDNHLLHDFFIHHSPEVVSKGSPITTEPFVLFEKDAFLMNFITSLEILLSTKQILSSELSKLKLGELLHYLKAKYPAKFKLIQQLSAQKGSDFLLRQAVTSNMYNAVTVDELAFLSHMSLSTFKRRFAQVYGTSPSKWLLNHRMQKAAQLLKHGEARVSEIYTDLGYENLSSFIQSFKQVHGVTPKQYQLSV